MGVAKCRAELWSRLSFGNPEQMDDVDDKTQGTEGFQWVTSGYHGVNGAPEKSVGA